MEEKEVLKVLDIVEEIMKFMKDHLTTFFLSEYEPASQSYLHEAGVQ